MAKTCYLLLHQFVLVNTAISTLYADPRDVARNLAIKEVTLKESVTLSPKVARSWSAIGAKYLYKNPLVGIVEVFRYRRLQLEE